MKPTYRVCHRKVANWPALLTIATILLSGSALPSAHAAPQVRQIAVARGVNQSATPTATCTDGSLAAPGDTYLSTANVTHNNGGNTALHTNGTIGTDRRIALLKWDVSPSGIPSNATVSAASTSLHVTDASAARKFSLPHDMDGGAASARMDDVTAVTSGPVTPVSWPDRTPGVEYVSYAASGGRTTTTGPKLAFAAAAAACFPLTLGHTGNGSTPVASPTQVGGMHHKRPVCRRTGHQLERRGA